MISEQFVFACLRQGLLFLHLLLFAYAIVRVLSEDFALLRAQRIDPAKLKTAEKHVSAVLLGLWLTGFGLIALKLNGDPAVLLEDPKLVAKVLVVGILTLNGLALHYIAFPRLCTPSATPRICSTICAVFGSVSTASWLYAAFVGNARVLAPFMTLEMFVALYLLAVVCGIVVALVAVRPRLQRLMGQPDQPATPPMDQGSDAPAHTGLAR